MSLAVQIAFDCHDADKLAGFWAVALDYILQPPPDGFESWPAFLEANDIPVAEQGAINAIVDPDGVGPRVLFQRVPEPKTAKNRCHVDLRTEDRPSVQTEADRLTAVGASLTRAAKEEFGVYWATLQDPEGNEFCIGAA